MTGLRGRCGGLVRKPTGFVANHPSLLDPLRAHEILESSRNTTAAQVWTWTLARAVAEGISKLQRSITNETALPSIATGADDTVRGDVDDGAEAWRKCPGCKGRMAATDPSHTREPGVCKHPSVEPIVYGCKGCQDRRPMAHSSHTYLPGECKFHTGGGRIVATRRRGKHPRPPATPASDLPAADAQAQLPDGSDL